MSRLNEMKVFGLPLQFVVVVVLSLAMAIFFGAWAADARVEARSQELSLSGVHSLYVQSYAAGGPYGSNSSAYGDSQSQSAALASNRIPGEQVEQEPWERAFLFACPLH